MIENIDNINNPCILKLYVTYSQVAVFDASLMKPFNDWNDRHVKQGFSWRPGSVSFRTLIESGYLNIKITLGSEANPDISKIIRAIRIPFEVPKHGLIDFSSITEGKKFQIPSGPYNLFYETGYGNDQSIWVNFRFIHGANDPPLILTRDGALDDVDDYLMDAQPA